MYRLIFFSAPHVSAQRLSASFSFRKLKSVAYLIFKCLTPLPIKNFLGLRKFKF